MTPEQWKKAREHLDWRTIQNNKKNTIQVNLNESREHFLKKAEICRDLIEQGHSFICECIFKGGKGRADIYVITADGPFAIEVVHSEDTTKSGKEKYPVPVEFISTK